jgi:hypothetical protein
VKPREVEHDAQVYQAYLREADKLAERDAHIDRVVLDYELKLMIRSERGESGHRHGTSDQPLYR